MLSSTQRFHFFSSESSTDNSLNTAKIEKELGTLHRTVGSLYARGEYEEAMDAAKEAESLATKTYGDEHPVSASCSNNVGLIHKALGLHEEAIKQFEKATSMYFHAVGPEHRSTAVAFHNLALSYKAVSDTLTGMSRLSMLDQAKTTFDEALKSCESALGKDHSTTALAAAGLASVLRELALSSSKTPSSKETETSSLRELHGDVERAEKLLRDAAESLSGKTKKVDVLARATVLNNWAYHIKTLGDTDRYDDAERMYLEAVEARTIHLNEKHPETIAARNNLAELYISMDRIKDAQETQESILNDLGISQESVMEGVVPKGEGN